jgi:hypothetical protein
MSDTKAIIEAAEEASKEHAARDPNLAALRKARIGNPALVKTPEGEDAYWIVPFIIENEACGFAFVEKTLKVSRLGIFGGGPTDQASWITASFFEKPPPETISDIRNRYSHMRISDPLLSYDRSPSKWGWIVNLKNERELTIVITPSGWYEQTAKKKALEG